MTDFLATTRDSYDQLADEYDARFADVGLHPLDRAIYRAFAESVGDDGVVVDVGCGTGVTTDILHTDGLDAFGIDISPGMVEVARRTYPALRFEVGSMLALDVADGALAGLVAAHSIIHVPWEHRPAVFAEFYRVLAPGGQLMLSFQVGDERRHRTEVWGKQVDLTWYRQRPADVADILHTAGFEVHAEFVRQPEPHEKCPHARVLTTKPVQ